MMSRTKTIFSILAVLVVLALIILAANFKNLQRLMKVNSLFDEDKIVYNFSHMDESLFSDPLPVSGSKHVWPLDLQPLPRTFVNGDTIEVVENVLLDTRTTALVVVKDGTIIYENYFLGTDSDDLRISWSMSKSFVSSLIGVALRDGDIKSLDDQVIDYAPLLKGSAYDGATLRNVLQMSSGVEFDEDYLDPKSDINKMGRALALGGSLDDFAASIKTRAREPGSGRLYVSIDTHVIAMVLRGATGKSLQEYFIEKLWSKMGPGADAFYSTDGDGNAFALGGLNMRTRDYALFGELIRNDGFREGVEIIPSDWISESTRDTAPADVEGFPFGYGYQWWVPVKSDDEFFAVGVYGQYIYINPKAGIVIAKNAAHREFLDTDKVEGGHMARNVEMFRGIAAHFSEWEQPTVP